MAESQRKSADTRTTDEKEEDRKNLLFLIGAGFGAIAIVAGMLLLAGFLSGDEAGNGTLVTFIVAGATAAVFLLIHPVGQFFRKRKANKA